jgi:hypothetical protein
MGAFGATWRFLALVGARSFADAMLSLMQHALMHEEISAKCIQLSNVARLYSFD